jgi:hypothetical protein
MSSTGNSYHNHGDFNMTYNCHHTSVSIERPAETVYEYVRNPENLPEWAGEFVFEVWTVNGQWAAESSLGTIGFCIADKNDFGVLDHVITLPDGYEVCNPMRVFPNGDGCEVVITVFQLPDASSKDFSEDLVAVYTDLCRLKEIMEMDLE